MTTPNTPTPRTDAAAGTLNIHSEFQRFNCPSIDTLVSIDFARTLERELASADKEIERLKLVNQMLDARDVEDNLRRELTEANTRTQHHVNLQLQSEAACCDLACERDQLRAEVVEAHRMADFNEQVIEELRAEVERLKQQTKIATLQN